MRDIEKNNGGERKMKKQIEKTSSDRTGVVHAAILPILHAPYPCPLSVRGITINYVCDTCGKKIKVTVNKKDDLKLNSLLDAYTKDIAPQITCKCTRKADKEFLIALKDKRKEGVGR